MVFWGCRSLFPDGAWTDLGLLVKWRCQWRDWGASSPFDLLNELKPAIAENGVRLGKYLPSSRRNDLPPRIRGQLTSTFADPGTQGFPLASAGGSFSFVGENKLECVLRRDPELACSSRKSASRFGTVPHAGPRPRRRSCGRLQ